MKKLGKALILFPFMLWLVLLIVIPLVLIAFYAFTSYDGDVLRFSLEHFKEFLNPDLIKVLVRSLWLSLIATMICLLAGYPLALILAGDTFKKKEILLILFMVPMWMNFLLRTYAWMTLLGNNGIINSILGFVGLGPYKLLNTQGAVVLGMIYNYIPYMILPLYSVMVKIDKSVLEAASDLGCNGAKVLFKVILPLSVPGITSGITMVFVPAISTFIISRMLGGGSNLLIGDLIEMQFLGNSYNPNLGAAISFVLMIIVLIIMTVMNQFDGDDDKVLI